MALGFMLATSAARIVVMVMLAWITLNPSVLLGILNLPPSVTNSLEMDQPEGIVLVLAPFVVLILGASAIIGAIQKQAIRAASLVLGGDEEDEEEFAQTTDKGELVAEEEFIKALEEEALERQAMSSSQ